MVNPFPNVCLSNVEGAPFMCLTSISIYIDYWKSFMKFRAEKSHEMISYNLSGIASSGNANMGCRPNLATLLKQS